MTSHSQNNAWQGSAKLPEYRNRIELRLRHVNQLFNSLDPSPFYEQDLDSDAEEFIVGWVAVWRPLEIFLYDGWPVAGARQLYQSLRAAEFALVEDAKG